MEKIANKHQEQIYEETHFAKSRSKWVWPNEAQKIVDETELPV